MQPGGQRRGASAAHPSGTGRTDTNTGGACPASTAAGGAAAAAPTPLTVMVVDVQALLQNSKAAKMVRGQIEQKRNEYTKEISHQEETLRAERDALQRQQASLSADALNQKGRDFNKRSMIWNGMSKANARLSRSRMARRSQRSKRKC